MECAELDQFDASPREPGEFRNVLDAPFGGQNQQDLPGIELQSIKEAVTGGGAAEDRVSEFLRQRFGISAGAVYRNEKELQRWAQMVRATTKEGAKVVLHGPRTYNPELSV